MRYLVDSCIRMDLKEDRADRLRPLAEWAFRFFQKATVEEALIFYTDFTEIEIMKNYKVKNVGLVFVYAVNDYPLLKRIEVNQKQYHEASLLSKIRNVPFGDALNAVVARDLSAIVVTRDHHFEDLQDIVISKKPEELI